MYDVIVYGATGFTGALVAEYLHNTYGSDGELRWALGGRSAARLKEVRTRIGASEKVGIVIADASAPESLRTMAARTRAVITTVGPYQFYGEPLLLACIENNTDYVDLCGEVGWMSEMIERYGEQAAASDARIVFSCGFDSVPFDLGVFTLQQLAREHGGQPLAAVSGRVRDVRGELSGGTIASGIATFETAARDEVYRQRVENPFSLVPGFTGAPQPDDSAAKYDANIASWVAPFEMATINTKNVHRSNALLGHAYGVDFSYDEMAMTGDGKAGQRKAKAIATRVRLTEKVLAIKPLRTLLQKTVLAKPGEGPSRAKRDAGYYDLLFVGTTQAGDTLAIRVHGDEDPGYGSTSKMLSESALCLLWDLPSREALPGGIWTPASAMGDKLVRRLTEHAGITFTEEAV